MKKRTLLSTICLVTALISSIAPTVYAVETPSGNIVGSLGESVPLGTNQETEIPPNIPIPEASTPDPESVTEEPQEDTVSNPPKEEQTEVPNKVVANPTENLTENDPVTDGSAETNLSEDSVVDDATADYNGDLGTVHWLLKDGVLHYGAGVLPDGKVIYNNNIPMEIRDQVQRVIFDDKVIAGISLRDFFKDFTSLQRIDNLINLDTSNVTDMSRMFYIDLRGQPSKLTTFDVSGFNTANVTDMRQMFSGCDHVPVLDISHFDTSKVTNMNGMFANCTNLMTLDVSGFNTANVTDMSQMFIGCRNLTSLDLSNFETSNVNDMSQMFDACNSLTALNISGFNTANVTDMSQMFSGLNSLTMLEVSNFNTTKVTNMFAMFANSDALTALDLSRFNTANVTDMSQLFSGCRDLASLDISNFDTGNVSRMNQLFQSTNKLAHLIIGKNSRFSELPNILQTDGIVWRKNKVGAGYTNDELISQYDGSTMAGDWYFVPNSLELKALILYKDDSWNPADNVIAWLSKDGLSVPMDKIQVEGLVDIHVPKKYTVMYTYEGEKFETSVTVLQSPNYSVQLPANLQFTKLNEPANGSDLGSAVNYTVKLVNTGDKQAYSGETNVKIGVASANSWQLKDKKNAVGATYQLTDGTGTDIGTSGYAFYLNKETNEKTLTANLTNKANKSGNYFDTLTFTYGKEP